MREGFIKLIGIVGVVWIGNFMRILLDCILVVLCEIELLWVKEIDEEVRERGKKFWMNIYVRNLVFDLEVLVWVSLDYVFVV